MKVKNVKDWYKENLSDLWEKSCECYETISKRSESYGAYSPELENRPSQKLESTARENPSSARRLRV